MQRSRRTGEPGRVRASVLAAVALITIVPLVASLALVSLVTARPSHGPHAVSAGNQAVTTEIVRQRFRLSPTGGGLFAPNYANYASRTIASSPLLLFLAATHHRPSDYTAFLHTARAAGFHVLALDYWNLGHSVQKTCGSDPECYGAVQRNRLTGSDPNTFSAVDRQNSIVNRFTAAIDRLSVTDPTGGWGRFLDAKGIDWSRIVVAGHSQGGGESAYIAHIHAVRGALFFSSPVDSDNGIEASWMHHRGKTPASRMYGFDDTGDIFASRIVASWNALGMGAFGGPQDTAAAPYTSHELLTHVDLGTPGSSHLRTITNESPRTASGASVFVPVWKWMLARVYGANQSIDRSQAEA